MFRRNDEDSTSRKIERLYDKYKALMFREANIILNDACLAEDAVHQSFIKIMNNLDKIDENAERRTRNFLVIICRHAALDLYKKRLYLNRNPDNSNFEFEDEEEEIQIDYAEPSQIIIDKETVARVSKEIDKLPPIYKDVLLLEKLHNNTKEEIAELLGIKYETVRKRSLRARKMLAEALEREEDLN